MGVRLQIVEPCSHSRFDGQRHTCVVLGECKPIQDATSSPIDLSACPSFFTPRMKTQANGRQIDIEHGIIKPHAAAERCVHLGDEIRDDAGMRVTVECKTCPSQLGRPNRKPLHACAVFGQCTTDGKAEGVASCKGCPEERTPQTGPLSILFTGGIGDVIAVEGLMTPEERERLTTIYYACPARLAVAKMLQALPNFPRLKNHVMLTNIGTDGKVYLKQSDVEDDHGKLPAEVEDWSIMKQFHAGTPYRGSSFLSHQLSTRPALPTPYAVVCPVSQWGKWEDRNFNDDDWRTCLATLDSRKWHGVVLLRDKMPVPDHPRLVNMTGGLNILESVEVVKGAVGYLGIDTWATVLATKLFPASSLAIKSVNPHCYKWKGTYFAPWTEFPFLQRTLTAPRPA